MAGNDSEDVVKAVLDLDNQEFVSKLKESLGLFGELGEGGASALEPLKTALLDLATGPIGLVIAGMAGIAAAIELTTEGEKINQINKSFETLASNAGLAGDALKEKLLASTKGLVSETELLQGVNQELVRMGANAGRMPEVMEAARKATALFGGDLMSNFAGMSRAMETGNAKMLARYGLTVNVTKAHEDYARQLGIGVQFLDDEAKKTAVLNAALEVAKEKYAGVDESSLKTTNSLTKIKVAFAELGELAVTVWNKVAGPTVSALVSSFADKIHGLVVDLKAVFATGKEQSDARVESLKREGKELELIILQNEKYMAPTELAEKKKRLDEIYKTLGQIHETEKKNADLKAGEKKEEKTGPSDEEVKKRLEEQEKYKQAKTKLESDLLKIHEQRIKSDEQMETNATKMMEDIDAQEATIKKQRAVEFEKVKKQMHDVGINDEKRIAQAKEDIWKKADNDIAQLELKRDAERLRALKNYEDQNKHSAKGITAAWAHDSEQQRQNFTDMTKLGHTAFNAVGNNAKSMFEKIGKGSQDGASLMKQFFLSALGDIAIEQGTAMLLMGLWPPNPIAIAGGGALIALGTAMKSMGGSSGGSSSSSGYSGGGGSVSAASSTSSSPTPTQAAAKSTVSINFAGHYFDTQQTQDRLVQMIRANSDATDFSFKTIGSP